MGDKPVRVNNNFHLRAGQRAILRNGDPTTTLDYEKAQTDKNSQLEVKGGKNNMVVNDLVTSGKVTFGILLI